jgi:hypothetical protein
MKPDKFQVTLGDYGAAVDLAFSEGEGERRLCVGCRLDAAMARMVGAALIHYADQAEEKVDVRTVRHPST